MTILNKSKQVQAESIQPEPPRLDQHPQNPSAALLSRREVAERWRCCEHTVARRKDLKPLRFNSRLLRYRVQDIEAIEAAAAA
jgi:hypothetical protein